MTRNKKIWNILACALFMFFIIGLNNLFVQGNKLVDENMLDLSLAFNDLDNELQHFLTSRNVSGISSLKQAKIKFENKLKSVQNGDEKTILRFVPSNIKSYFGAADLSKTNFSLINEHWGDSQKNINSLVKHSAQYEKFQKSIVETQENNKSMQAAYKNLIKFLVENHFSGNKIATVQRQPWLADRVSLRLLWLQRPLAFSPDGMKVLGEESKRFSNTAIPLLKAQLSKLATESVELKSILDVLYPSINDYSKSLNAVASNGDALLKLDIHSVIQNVSVETVDKEVAKVSKIAASDVGRKIFSILASNYLFLCALALSLFALFKLKASSVNNSDEQKVNKKSSVDDMLREFETIDQHKHAANNHNLKTRTDAEFEKALAVAIKEQVNIAPKETLQQIETIQSSLNTDENKEIINKEAFDSAVAAAVEIEVEAAKQKIMQQAESDVAQMKREAGDKTRTDKEFDSAVAAAVEVEVESAKQKIMQQAESDVEQMKHQVGDKTRTDKEFDSAVAATVKDQVDSAVSSYERSLNIESFGAQIDAIKRGDLSVELDVSKTALGAVSNDINTITKNMQHLVKALKISATQTALVASKRDVFFNESNLNVNDLNMLSDQVTKLLNRTDTLEVNFKLKTSATDDHEERDRLLLDELSKVKESGASILDKLSELTQPDRVKSASSGNEKLFDSLERVSQKMKAIASNFVTS